MPAGDKPVIAVTNAAPRIHGARGHSRDLPLERMVGDARLSTIGGGTAEKRRNLIGREVLNALATPLRDVAWG